MGIEMAAQESAIYRFATREEVLHPAQPLFRTLLKVPLAHLWIQKHGSSCES